MEIGRVMDWKREQEKWRNKTKKDVWKQTKREFSTGMGFCFKLSKRSWQCKRFRWRKPGTWGMQSWGGSWVLRSPALSFGCSAWLSTANRGHLYWSPAATGNMLRTLTSSPCTPFSVEDIAAMHRMTITPSLQSLRLRLFALSCLAVAHS